MAERGHPFHDNQGSRGYTGSRRFADDSSARRDRGRRGDFDRDSFSLEENGTLYGDRYDRSSDIDTRYGRERDEEQDQRFGIWPDERQDGPRRYNEDSQGYGDRSRRMAGSQNERSFGPFGNPETKRHANHSGSRLGALDYSSERGIGNWNHESSYDRGTSGAESQGRFYGRGPKGYQRSDQRLHENVCDALADHPDIDASEIEVKVQGCEVTLTGTVEDRRTKRMAEEAAERVRGVKDVTNQLRIQSQSSSFQGSSSENAQGTMSSSDMTKSSSGLSTSQSHNSSRPKTDKLS